MARKMTTNEREWIEKHQLSFNFESFLDSLPEVVWDDKGITGLMTALLERSLEIIRNKSSKTASFAEEMAWFFSDDRSEPFAALNCAEVAGYDLEDIRQGLDFALPQDKRDHMRLLDNGAYDGRFNYESSRWGRERNIARPMYA